MKRILRFLLPLAALMGGLATLAACSSAKPTNGPPQAASLTQYVDPYIGTGGHGHVFLGANVPFGAVQLGPVNLSQGWDWCSGYHYSDSTIVGFAHTHLSGTGIGDLGDVAVMPTTGAVLVGKGTLKNPAAGFVSRFSHQAVFAPGRARAAQLLRRAPAALRHQSRADGQRAGRLSPVSTRSPSPTRRTYCTKKPAAG